MIRAKKAIFLLLPVLFTTFVSAENTSNDSLLQKLQDQINNQAFNKAWELANQNKNEYLGDENFDFLYGIAALANNEAEHAVFAFERVIANKPNWLDAHYLLAKSNHKIANYQAAISGSKFLLTHSKSSNSLKKSVNELIELSQSQLDKQSLDLNQNISLAVGHDSNINSGTNEDDIFLPFLGQSIPLSETSKENSDNYASLTYKISGSKTLSQLTKIVFTGQGNIHRFSKESSYDRLYANLAANYVRQFDIGKASIGVKYTPLWLDDDFYRNKSAIIASFEKKLAHQLTGTFGVEVGKTSNKINKNLNTDNSSINAGVHYFVNNSKHSIGVSYTDEKSEIEESNHNSRKLTTINYSTLWLINQAWTVSSYLAYQKNDYQAFHPFFLQQREDKMWLASANIQYQHSKAWSYRLNVNAQNKNSNVSLFSYERSDISLTAIFNF